MKQERQGHQEKKSNPSQQAPSNPQQNPAHQHPHHKKGSGGCSC